MGKVIEIDELKKIRTELKKLKKKVVFTNGVFDILHRGHIEYLNKARRLGDVMIVGVNSDASVKRIKGSKRPIVTENDRAFIIANLKSVDYVCIFEEDTPLNLIKELLPDVLIKGADWDKNNIVGKDIVEKSGGYVETIEFIPQKSTTSIIETIIERYCKE